MSARNSTPTKLPSISLVVPCLNERETLADLHDRLVMVLPDIAEKYEIIFVDDGSTDDSIEILKRLATPDRRSRYIQFRRNFGKSAALAAGFRAARYDVIATMDADLQDLPEELPRL